MNLTEAPSSIPLPDPTFDPARAFLDAALAGKNIFLSGMAGTGKTTLLRKFIDADDDDAVFWRDVDVVAPTGVAALNIGGMTIHRWCGMLLGPASGQRDPTETNEEYYRWLRDQQYRSILRGFERVRYCKILVIDEISMLPGRQLEFVEWLFRKLRHDDRPWGGCQVIVVGDFLQLAPVKKDDSLPYDWAFKHEVWDRSGFTPILLEKIHRQNEVDFIAALCGVRSNCLSERSKAVLYGRIANFPSEEIPRLFTHNAQVDRWNSQCLGSLATDARTFLGRRMGDPKNADFLADNVMCPEELILKVGAQVMTTVNDSEGRYVNGTIGHVVGFDDGAIQIEDKLGRDFWVEPFTWSYGKESEQGFAQYTQFPLRLAYALTIHKCQGLTMDEAYIDVRAARAPGQTYVALSRVRTLAGLHLKDWANWIYASDDALAFYARMRKAQQAAADTSH